MKKFFIKLIGYSIVLLFFFWSIMFTFGVFAIVMTFEPNYFFMFIKFWHHSSNIFFMALRGIAFFISILLTIAVAVEVELS